MVLASLKRKQEAAGGNIMLLRKVILQAWDVSFSFYPLVKCIT